MTTGTKDTIVGSTVSYYYQDLSDPNPRYQGEGNLSNGLRKSWGGADRVKVIIPKLPREKKYYYVLRTKTFINKRGRRVTKTYRVRRSYTVLASPRKRKSSSVPNVYSMTLIRQSQAIYQGVNRVTGQKLIDVTPVMFGAMPSFDSTLFTANDDIRLINKLSELIRGSDFNAAVFLAEGGKALEMIGNAAIKLAAGLRHVKKGNLAAAVQAFTGRKPAVQGRTPRGGYVSSKSIEKTWLESSYGWQPLLKDVHGGAEMLANVVNSSMVRRYKVRSVKRALGMPAALNDSASTVTKKQIIAYITKKESLANQLGLLNPELVAWELLPFSFVFDWFMPVGNFLAARAFTTSDMEGTFVTTTFKKVSVKGFKYRSNVDFSGGVFDHEEVTLSREVSSSLAVPYPEFVPVNKILNWKRALNAVALISVLRPRG